MCPERKWMHLDPRRKLHFASSFHISDAVLWNTSTSAQKINGCCFGLLLLGGQKFDARVIGHVAGNIEKLKGCLDGSPLFNPF